MSGNTLTIIGSLLIVICAVFLVAMKMRYEHLPVSRAVLFAAIPGWEKNPLQRFARLGQLGGAFWLIGGLFLEGLTEWLGLSWIAIGISVAILLTPLLWFVLYSRSKNWGQIAEDMEKSKLSNNTDGSNR